MKSKSMTHACGLAYMVCSYTVEDMYEIESSF